MTVGTHEYYLILTANDFEKLLDKGVLLADANSTLDQARLVNNGIQI